jgi:DNA repair protein RadC
MSNFTVAELKPQWKTKPLPFRKRSRITSSKDIFDLIYPVIWDIDLYESFYVILLDRQNGMLGVSLISTGGVSGTVVDPKKVFQMALLAHSSSIILVHNHPSGNLIPSNEDVKLTKQLVNGGKFLAISVLDHLIVTPDGEYFSFADNGQIQ